MAKPEKQISIKIDGTERAYQEKRKQLPRHQEGRQVTLKNNVHSHANEDVVIINNNQEKHTVHFDKSEIAATNDEVNERTFEEQTFPWILPNESEVRASNNIKVEDVRSKKNKQRNFIRFGRRNRQKLLSIWLTVFFAILVGTSFGFIIKKFIIHDEPVDQLTKNEQSVIIDQVDQHQQADTNTPFTIPEKPIFIIQSGVFSTEEAAKQLTNELTIKQIQPEIIEQDGQLFVILGVFANIDVAKEVGAILQAKGMDVYAKEFYLSGKQLTAISEAEQQFLKESWTLLELIATNSSAFFLNVTLQDDWQQSLTPLVTSIKEREINNEQLNHLKNDLLHASTLLQDNHTAMDETKFFDLQKQLLLFIKKYDSL